MAPTRPIGVLLSIIAAVVFAAGAFGAYAKSLQYKDEAEWYLLRGNADGAEYANTFDNAYAASQTAAFENHHSSMERAHFWQRLAMLAVLASVVSGFAGWVFYLLYRLRQQLISVDAATSLISP